MQSPRSRRTQSRPLRAHRRRVQLQPLIVLVRLGAWRQAGVRPAADDGTASRRRAQGALCRRRPRRRRDPCRRACLVVVQQRRRWSHSRSECTQRCAVQQVSREYLSFLAFFSTMETSSTRHVVLTLLATPQAGLASIGPGARWGAVMKEIEKYNRTAAGGREGNVGVGGLLLGGGLSFYTGCVSPYRASCLGRAANTPSNLAANVALLQMTCSTTRSFSPMAAS